MRFNPQERLRLYVYENPPLRYDVLGVNLIPLDMKLSALT
jgi:hypothetical protein